MSSVLDAAYMTAQECPGGAKALALRLGVNAAVLSNRLNPNNHDHHLTVRDLMAMMTLTGDHRALHAACLELGYMALPLPTAADETTVEALTDACKEFADFLQSVTKSLSDGKVSRLELRSIRKELGEMVASAGRLESIMATMEAKGSKR